MRVGDVCATLEQWAPSGYAYEWDHSGLNIGETGVDVTTVLVALNVTVEVFKAAKRARAQMIVSHHPVLWSPLRTLRTDDAHTRLCLDLAHAGIACYSAHTNLDVAPGGMNHILAARLGLRRVKPLIAAASGAQVKLVTFTPESHLRRVRDAVCAAGAGVIGAYTRCSFSSLGTGTFLPGGEARPFSGRKGRVNEEPEVRFEVIAPRARVGRVVSALKAAHPYEEVAYDIVRLENNDPGVGLGVRGELDHGMTLEALAKLARKQFALSHVRVVGRARGRIRRVAILGGSGGGEVDEIPGDIEVYITGDVRYHDALNALEKGLSVIDAGHAGLEKWMAPAVAAYLKKKLKGLKVVTYAEPDPFRVVV